MDKTLEKEILAVYNQLSDKLRTKTEPPQRTEEEIKRGYSILDEPFLEKNVSKREISINCHVDEFNRYPFPHRHDFFELIYVYSGKMNNLIESRDILLNSGDFLIMNPSVIHMPVTESGTLSLNILLKKELFHKTFTNLLLSNNLFADFFVNSLKDNKAARKYMLFSGKYIEQDRIQPYLLLLLKEYSLSDYYVNQNIQSLISCIFSELSRSDLKKQKALSVQEKSVSVDEIVRYICRNFHTATLENTAAYFGYHPKYLSSMLSKQYGKTFSDIRKLYRIHYAAALLVESSLSVGDIIQKAGYTNSTYFYKIFEETFQVSPTQYRIQKPDSNLLAYFPTT